MKKHHVVTVLVGVLVVVGGSMLLSKDAEAPEVTVTPEATTPAPTETVATPKKAASSPAIAPAKVVQPVRLFENGTYVSVIKLTNSGFVPQAVTIARGESVRFVNASGSSMRILSTEYNGLNQEKSVGNGGIYELTFPQTGTWAFRNGTNLNVIGVVNVQ